MAFLNRCFQAARLLPAAWLFLLVCSGCGKNISEKPATVSDAAPKSERITFVQWSDPHVFDAGAARQGEEIEEEPLDNWSALHWAVMQTNRLSREDRTIDFVAITGDFGLYNVTLPKLKDRNGKEIPDQPCQHDPKQGPGTPVSIEEAANAIARELRALVVKKVYLVPGNNDLCDEDPRNQYRYAEFVLKLKLAIQEQQEARAENLEKAGKSLKRQEDLAAKAAGKSAKKAGPPTTIPAAPPVPPQVIDLTFTLERLLKAQNEHALALVNDLSESAKQQYLRPEPKPGMQNPGFCYSDRGGAVPMEKGFCLLGLDSSYFKLHSDPLTDFKTITSESYAASKEAMDTLNGQIKTGGSYLLFTHIPDMEDPFKPGLGSAWKLDDPVRSTWKEVLGKKELVAVFAGHFHSTRRDIYPHNFSYIKNPPVDGVVAEKFWLSPSLAAKYQSGLPTLQTARGIFVFSVTRDGAGGISAANNAAVEATPIWFSALNQKPPLPAEDKLAAARAYEKDRQWDKAAEKYLDLIGNANLDSATREIAFAGYTRALATMDQRWWKSPLIRWAYVHEWALVYTAGVVLAGFIVCWLLRILWLSRLMFLVLRLLMVPGFRGRARLNNTVKLSPNAPVESFPSEILAAAEEIRTRLEREQEAWAARHISLLVPAGSAFDDVLGNIPKVKDVDISPWLKFLAAMARLFQWNVDTAMAVLPAPAPIPAAAPAPTGVPAPLPVGGELSGYATLRWAWFTKNTWRRKVTIVAGTSASAELARQLAALILGEAFL